jgi:adenylate cyclase
MDSETDYLADGITENLINSLSGRLLRVVPQSVVFAYQGRELDARAAASGLGVRAILTGSIVRRDDALIVQAELIDCLAVSPIWTGRYERALADFLAVQEDIAAQVTAALQVRPAGVPARRVFAVYRTTSDSRAG